MSSDNDPTRAASEAPGPRQGAPSSPREAWADHGTALRSAVDELGTRLLAATAGEGRIDLWLTPHRPQETEEFSALRGRMTRSIDALATHIGYPVSVDWHDVGDPVVALVTASSMYVSEAGTWWKASKFGPSDVPLSAPTRTWEVRALGESELLGNVERDAEVSVRDLTLVSVEDIEVGMRVWFEGRDSWAFTSPIVEAYRGHRVSEVQADGAHLGWTRDSVWLAESGRVRLLHSANDASEDSLQADELYVSPPWAPYERLDAVVARSPRRRRVDGIIRIVSRSGTRRSRDRISTQPKPTSRP